MNQMTNVFTKAAGPRQFYECNTKLGMVDIYQPPACEGVLEDRSKTEEELKVTTKA